MLIAQLVIALSLSLSLSFLLSVLSLFFRLHLIRGNTRDAYGLFRTFVIDKSSSGHWSYVAKRFDACCMTRDPVHPSIHPSISRSVGRSSQLVGRAMSFLPRATVRRVRPTHPGIDDVRPTSISRSLLGAKWVGRFDAGIGWSHRDGELVTTTLQS